jgi:hypothetical protein
MQINTAWSRRTASMLPCDSGFPPSAPRTGQVAFTTSGAPIPAASRIFALVSPHVSDSILLPVLVFGVPGMSRPLPPVSSSPGLPGRASFRRVIRVRCPHKSIGDLSTYPEGSSCGFRRCSSSTLSVFFRCPSVTLVTCEQVREAYLQQ